YIEVGITNARRRIQNTNATGSSSANSRNLLTTFPRPAISYHAVKSRSPILPAPLPIQPGAENSRKFPKSPAANSRDLPRISARLFSGIFGNSRQISGIFASFAAYYFLKQFFQLDSGCPTDTTTLRPKTPKSSP